MAVAFLWPGALLRYRERYDWVAGYNRASEEEKLEYDIEGLSHHLGNGLMTLGVLILGASLALALGRTGWSLGLMGVFVFVAFLIVVGGQKFTPQARFPQPGESGHTLHRFLRWLLPDRRYRALEASTRQWVYECSCGNLEDYWEAGGVRYKAVGEPRQLRRCQACGRTSFQKVRRRDS